MAKFGNTCITHRLTYIDFGVAVIYFDLFFIDLECFHFVFQQRSNRTDHPLKPI